MWPTTLSGRLPVVGLVGRYPTNYLMGREPIPRRQLATQRPPFAHSSCEPCAYGVLARVSPGYPPPRGRLLTRYSPVRRSPAPVPEGTGLLPHDLHVLGTPTAFALSQDQTLQRKLSPVLYFTFRLKLSPVGELLPTEHLNLKPSSGFLHPAGACPLFSCQRPARGFAPRRASI